MSNDKTFKLPELTYDEREFLVSLIYRRMVHLEMLLKNKSLRESMVRHYNDELSEATALYNKIQSHF